MAETPEKPERVPAKLAKARKLAVKQLIRDRRAPNPRGQVADDGSWQLPHQGLTVPVEIARGENWMSDWLTKEQRAAHREVAWNRLYEEDKRQRDERRSKLEEIVDYLAAQMCISDSHEADLKRLLLAFADEIIN